MTDAALGTVMVISRIGMPPAQMACTAEVASSTVAARTTGTIPISPILWITSSMVIRILCLGLFRHLTVFSAYNAGGLRLHSLQDFIPRCHCGVAGRGHGQCAMSGSALDGPLRFFPRQKSIDQSRGKRVTPAYPVEDFQIFANWRLVEAAVVVAHRSPTVHRCRSGVAQRGGDHFDRWKFLDHLFHHLLEVCWIQLRVVRVQSRSFES